MLNKHAVTNVILVLISGILLVAVAQGGLAQLSPLLMATPVERTPASTNGSPNGEAGVAEVPPLLERLLVYVFLIWALALGVEAGVEFIRWVFHLKLYLKPGPTDILNDLNPWLPKPVAIPEQPEAKQVKIGPSPPDTSAGHARSLLAEMILRFWWRKRRRCLASPCICIAI